MTFGQSLKKMRKERRMSKDELAKKAGFTVADITRFERMSTVPDPEIVQRLSDALGIEV